MLQKKNTLHKNDCKIVTKMTINKNEPKSHKLHLKKKFAPRIADSWLHAWAPVTEFIVSSTSETCLSFLEGFDFADEPSGLDWFQVDIWFLVSLTIVLDLNKELVWV